MAAARFQRAADIVFEHRSGSAALLQRHLSIGYGDAMRLATQLASQGVLDSPNPNGRYRFAFPMNVALRNEPHERHARALRDLAVYLTECGRQRDTRCIELLLDPLKCPLGPIEEVAFSQRHDAEPVLALARALSTLPALAPPPEAVAGVQAALIEFCAEVEPQHAQRNSATSEALHACLVRAVRYLNKRLHDGWGHHSRCLEYFVPDSFVPQGRGLDGNPTRREHVVPCVLLCAEATQMLKHCVPVEEVAAWIEPWLRIVWLDEQAVRKLDVELGLKTTVPKGWEFGRACVYARLHAADILFTSPIGGPECCGLDHRPASVTQCRLASPLLGTASPCGLTLPSV